MLREIRSLIIENTDEHYEEIVVKVYDDGDVIAHRNVPYERVNIVDDVTEAEIQEALQFGTQDYPIQDKE